MNKTLIARLAVVFALSTIVACSQPDDHTTATDGPSGAAGMALSVDILADTDVAAMQYTITAVDCGTGDPLDPAQVVEATRDLEDLVLPGGDLDLVGQPFDANSQHLFADAFFWLPEGCYDVVVQPLTEDGEPSADCAVASQNAVPVIDGQTTEITLIQQCGNEAFGGLDVIAALNHAPQIDDVSYAPSKFTCEDVTTICATVSDPDNDPLLVRWDALTAGAIVASVTEESGEDGSVTSCATIEVEGPGDYAIGLQVFDLAWDADGNLVPIEQLLLLQGSDATSSDTIVLPVHALSEEACVGDCSCPDGFELNAAGDLCERLTTTEAIYNGELLTVCTGSVNANYGAWGARLPDGGTILNSFFGEDFGDDNGSPLNTRGIWACGPDGQPTAQPVNEWIGFSRCLNIAEAGSYVIGIGADNLVRTRLNGQPLFTIDLNNISNALHPYRYMHLLPVTLPAGTNIIELEAMNLGGPAAFVAEIYGPFTAAEVQDDASMSVLDYANNVVWSTGDQLGSTFDTGTNSGWSCEDGAALDLCGDAATCTTIERLTCE